MHAWESLVGGTEAAYPEPHPPSPSPSRRGGAQPAQVLVIAASLRACFGGRSQARGDDSDLPAYNFPTTTTHGKTPAMAKKTAPEDLSLNDLQDEAEDIRKRITRLRT